MEPATDYVEAIVGNISELQGHLPLVKEVDVADHGKCLLIRHEDGEITALGHKCSHYGAPLARGAISNGVIRCPWHGACFNARTGDIEDYPGVDSIPTYQVSVDSGSGDISVQANIVELKSAKRKLHLNSNVDQCVDDGQTVLIVGGGPASLVCAETLRKSGFSGNITIICAESRLPYDRAKLSKLPDSNPDTILLRPNMQYYDDIRVKIILGTEATAIDSEAKKIAVKDDAGTKQLSYDFAFIATGGRPRTLKPMDGHDCENIHVLRTVDDANKMAESCRGHKVVLIGSSFIAMEIAAFLAKKKECESVTVVCGTRSKVPFQSSLGPQIGSLIMKMHEEKGVAFHTGVGVTELVYDAASNKVNQMRLTDGTLIDADIVVLGIGVIPNTEILRDSGVKMDERGYVLVDGEMRTNVEGLYAGGDIASFPMQMTEGRATNIQHWQMAHKHGQLAAKSIVRTAKKGSAPPSAIDSVPFFWTVQFGISIRYAGYSAKYDSVVIKSVDKSGNIVQEKEALEQKKFAAFYVINDHVVAIATMLSDPVAARFAQHVKYQGLFEARQIDQFLRGERVEGKRKAGCTLS